jgi:hypothetical protein
MDYAFKERDFTSQLTLVEDSVTAIGLSGVM